MTRPESSSESRASRAAASFGVLILLLLFSWLAHPHIHDVTKPFSLNNLLGYLVIAIPLTLVFVLMRRRGRHWRDYGMNARLTWWKVLGLAVLGFIAIVAVMQFALIPVIYRLDTTPPNVSHLLAVRGNTAGYITVLVGVWLTAAFGEEMLFRGFIMNEMTGAFGGTCGAWWVSAAMIAVFFGLGHAYQRLSGILITGSIGLMLNVLYLLVRRNLWVLILGARVHRYAFHNAPLPVLKAQAGSCACR